MASDQELNLVQQNIQNKIAAPSDDLLVAGAIVAAAELLRVSEVPAVVIGSCAIQAYLPNFFRLPNDLDLVIHEERIPDVVRSGNIAGHSFEPQLGRGQLLIDDFPVHLIPGEMNVIDKATNTIFTRLDLRQEIASAGFRDLHFLSSALIPRLPVASLEAVLFVELIRPIYTGSLIGLALLLERQTVDHARFGALFEKNVALQQIVLRRIGDYQLQLRRVTAVFGFPTTTAVGAFAGLQSEFGY